MSLMSLLKTDKMILFIIAFFAFIIIGYELNTTQINHSKTELSPTYLSVIQDHH